MAQILKENGDGNNLAAFMEMAIAFAISEIVYLLKPSEMYIRRSGADALLRLSKQGKKVNSSDPALLMKFIS
jgi:hypothetical protein